MKIITKNLKISTKFELQIINITNEIEKIIQLININSGIAVIFCKGSTGSITTIEYEPGLIEDFPNMLKRIIPNKINYKHELMWHDGNGHSHVRASLLGPSLSIPFTNKKLILGTWQQIIFIELDVKPRNRELIIQILGE